GLVQAGPVRQYLLAGVVEYVAHARTLRLSRPAPRPGTGGGSPQQSGPQSGRTCPPLRTPAGWRSGGRPGSARRRVAWHDPLVTAPRRASGSRRGYALSWLATLERRAELRDRAGLARRVRPRGPAEPVVDLAGNDYLGLSRHPEVVAAA